MYDDIKDVEYSGPGVYFFIGARGVLYVGSTTNIKSRMRSYIKEHTTMFSAKVRDIVYHLSEVTKVVVHPKTDRDIQAIEEEMISKINPVYNEKGNTRNEECGDVPRCSPCSHRLYWRERAKGWVCRNCDCRINYWKNKGPVFDADGKLCRIQTGEVDMDLQRGNLIYKPLCFL